eukprot:scaffold6749_cov114-Isochrysis_galbana.AAC.5
MAPRNGNGREMSIGMVNNFELLGCTSHELYIYWYKGRIRAGLKGVRTAKQMRDGLEDEKWRMGEKREMEKEGPGCGRRARYIGGSGKRPD